MKRGFLVPLLTFLIGTYIGLLLSHHAVGRRDELISASVYAREIVLAMELEKSGNYRGAYDGYTRALGILEAYSTQNEISSDVLFPLWAFALEPLQVSSQQIELNRMHMMKQATDNRRRLIEKMGIQ